MLDDILLFDENKTSYQALCNILSYNEPWFHAESNNIQLFEIDNQDIQ